MITRRGFVAGAAASSLPLIGHASPLASPRAREVFSGSTIFIGQSAVRSGPSQMLGDEMAFGMQAAFAAVNRAGGVNGRQLALKERDDGYEPNRCKDNTRALIEENVFALAGFVGTPTCAAVLPMVHEAGVPFVGCFTGAEALRQPRAAARHLQHQVGVQVISADQPRTDRDAPLVRRVQRRAHRAMVGCRGPPLDQLCTCFKAKLAKLRS